MECLNCGQKTSNPKFCSRNCSASYNNIYFPKRKANLVVCPTCGKTFKKKSRIYCSVLCYSESLKEKHEHTKKEKIKACVNRVCINCGISFVASSKNVNFCSRKCIGEHKGKPLIENWLNGTDLGTNKGKYNDALRDPIRNFIFKQADYACEICGNSEWNGKPIPLQIHHKDGDAHNNNPENLLVVCWNCHAQTETFGGKNKGKSTRKSRYK